MDTFGDSVIETFELTNWCHNWISAVLFRKTSSANWFLNRVMRWKVYGPMNG